METHTLAHPWQQTRPAAGETGRQALATKQKVLGFAGLGALLYFS